MSNQEMQSKVEDLRELRRMADELDAQITAIQDSIKAHMTAIGADELSGTDYKITWKTITGSRFDKKAMIAAFGQKCYDGFCKPTTTRRFVVA